MPPRSRGGDAAPRAAAPPVGAALLLLLLLLAVGACLRNVRAATLTVLDKAVRDAPAAAGRGGGCPALRSGDLVFVSFNGDLRDYPAPARPLLQRIIVHCGVALEHPQHGMCFVDSFAGARSAPRLHALAPDIFQGSAVRGGTVRALPLGPLLAAVRGCVWVRRLDARVAVDAGAMWAAVTAANASRVRNAFANMLLPRASGWVQRVLTGSAAPLVDVAPRDAAHAITCLQWLAALLSAGGVWATAPHALDAELAAVSPPNAARLAANWAAVSAAALPPPRGSAAFALSSDFSTQSAVPYARQFWGPEVYVPCVGCRLRGFGGILKI